jgi:Arc/MetJ-type ribon-helix-helix transcriptional regulator
MIVLTAEPNINEATYDANETRRKNLVLALQEGEESGEASFFDFDAFLAAKRQENAL